MFSKRNQKLLLKEIAKANTETDCPSTSDTKQQVKRCNTSQLATNDVKVDNSSTDNYINDDGDNLAKESSKDVLESTTQCSKEYIDSDLAKNFDNHSETKSVDMIQKTITESPNSHVELNMFAKRNKKLLNFIDKTKAMSKAKNPSNIEAKQPIVTSNTISTSKVVIKNDSYVNGNAINDGSDNSDSTFKTDILESKPQCIKEFTYKSNPAKINSKLKEYTEIDVFQKNMSEISNDNSKSATMLNATLQIEPNMETVKFCTKSSLKEDGINYNINGTYAPTDDKSIIISTINTDTVKNSWKYELQQVQPKQESNDLQNDMIKSKCIMMSPQNDNSQEKSIQFSDIGDTLINVSTIQEIEGTKGSYCSATHESVSIEKENEQKLAPTEASKDYDVKENDNSEAIDNTNQHVLTCANDEGKVENNEPMTNISYKIVEKVAKHDNEVYFTSDGSLNAKSMVALEEESIENISIASAPILDTNFRKLSSSIGQEQLERENKKRQWSRKDKAQEHHENSDIVSGELLKDIVPDIKPYLEEFSKEDELDHEHESDEKEVEQEESERSIDIAKHWPNLATVLMQKSNSEVELPSTKPFPTDSTEKNCNTISEKESTYRFNREKTCVIEIKNLVRPFQISRFKQLLEHKGSIKNIDSGGGFWIDKVKSRALIEYLSAEEAEAAVNAFHGMKWPESSPKKLFVSYSSRKALEKEINESEFLDQDDSYVGNKKETSNYDYRNRKRKSSENSQTSREKIKNYSESPPERESSDKEADIVKHKTNSMKPKKHLDDIFRKTKTVPCLYWLPRQ